MPDPTPPAPDPTSSTVPRTILPKPDRVGEPGAALDAPASASPDALSPTVLPWSEWSADDPGPARRAPEPADESGTPEPTVTARDAVPAPSDGVAPTLIPGHFGPTEPASVSWLMGERLSGSAAGGPAGEGAGDPRAEPGVRETVLGSHPKADGVRPGSGAVAGYELLSELGRGAMGVVHRARDVRLNRIVALKRVLSGSHAGDEDRIRFLEEARAVALLQHPNVVQVFEVGESGGTPFCALEYVAGGTLAGALRGVPQEPTGAATRALVLARAMAAVHAAGIVHRDLKPANILIGSDGTLKITDFGLAKRLDAPSGRTQAGQVMGTPSYMAPEQAVGDMNRVGPVSDVWALGAILYELLTGRPPFRGTGVWDTIAQVLTADPVPVRRLQPGCPRDLETVCLKCLEKDQLRRYPSATALADDLVRYLDGRPVLARRAGPVERTVKWARRSPVRAALVAAAAACTGMLAAVLVLQARSARQEAHQLRLEGELTRRELNDERRLGGVREQFAEQFADAEQRAVVASDAAAWDGVAQTLQSALQREGADPKAFAGWPLRASAAELLTRAKAAAAAARHGDAVRARARTLGERHGDAVFHATLAAGLASDESFERVRRAAADGLALFEVTVPGDGPPVVEPGILTPGEGLTVVHRCYELLLLDAEALARPVAGETVGALRERLREALTRLDRADRLLPGTRTRSGSARRAEYLTGLGREADARVAAASAAATPPVLAADYFLIGLDHYRAEEFGPAIADLAAALRVEPGHYGAQYLLAVCQLRDGHPQEAKLGLTQCLTQRPGFAWPRLLRASAEMDLARRGNGDYAVAREDLDAVLADPPDEAARYAALTNRGVLAVARRDWDGAVTDLTKAIELRPDSVPAYINLATAHRHRAELLALRGGVLNLTPFPGGAVGAIGVRVAHRAPALDAAVAVLDEALRRHPKDSRLYHERAQLHLLRGDAATARSDLLEAIRRAPNFGRQSTLADDLLQCGRVLHDAGEYKRAAEAYATVLAMPPARVGAERQALAARRLADSFIAIRDWSAASDALDQYLSLTAAEGLALAPKQAVQVAGALKARGLIHVRLKNLRGAADSYTRALGLVRDPEVLVLRGRVYLATGAAVLAEDDFKEVVELRPADIDALLGRAEARVKLGKSRDAVADAEEGARRIPDMAAAKDRVRLRYLAARVFAQATVRTPDPVKMAGRTADQLRAALADLAPAERAAFWRDALKDPLLDPVRESPAVQAVAAEAGLANP